MALVTLVGTLVWPEPFEPQAMIVPSERKASACAPPAAMATTLVRVAGTFVWPYGLAPQAMTVALLRRAMWKLVPEAMAATLASPAGAAAFVSPHWSTLPFCLRARL